MDIGGFYIPIHFFCFLFRLLKVWVRYSPLVSGCKGERKWSTLWILGSSEWPGSFAVGPAIEGSSPTPLERSKWRNRASVSASLVTLQPVKKKAFENRTSKQWKPGYLTLKGRVGRLSWFKSNSWEESKRQEKHWVNNRQESQAAIAIQEEHTLLFCKKL